MAAEASSPLNDLGFCPVISFCIATEQTNETVYDNCPSPRKRNAGLSTAVVHSELCSPQLASQPRMHSI